MKDWNYVIISLEHRVRLEDEDPYDEIIQHYQSRIVRVREEKETLAGTFDFYVANVSLAVNRGVDIVDVADSIDGDLCAYCEALFEAGTASDLRDEVTEQFEYPTGSRVLMLHLAKVLPEFRGQNLGLVAARKIIEQFGDGLVVAKAQPLQHHDGFNDESAMAYETFEPVRDTALKRLTRHWQRLGFKPIGDTGYLGLNTANNLPVPQIRPLRSTTAKARKQTTSPRTRSTRPPKR